MIRSRMTTKNCNICMKVVAVKELFGYRTMVGYVTLRRELESFLHRSDRDDVHICNDCWEQMGETICSKLKREETLRKQWSDKKT